MLSSRSLNALILGCTLLVAGCDRQSDAPAQGEPSAAATAAAVPVGKEGATIDRSRKGSQLPDFVLKDAAGKQQPLAALKGKPLLINLWATWCAPCVAELPTLDKLAATGTVKVLTVSQDLRGTEKVAPFLAEKGGKTLEPWIDSANDLSVHYEVQALPSTILYDAQGREVWRISGPMDWSDAEAARLVAEAGG